MNVKLKTLVIGFISLLFVAIFTSLIYNIGIFKYVNNIEKQHIDDDYKILNIIINREYDSLHNTCLDWGHWDDTYRFIQGENRQEYIQTNLQEDTLKQLNINFMYFYDAEGNLINSSTRNVPSNMKQLIISKLSNKSKLQFKSEDGSNICILNISGKLYIVSSTNITTTDESAKTNGNLIIGKQIDSSIINYINSVTKNKVEIDGSGKFNNISDEKYSKANDYIVSYRKIKDINGNKSITYSITMSRNEYKLGKLYFWSFVIIFMILLTITFVIMIRLFDKYVLKRLKIVNDFIYDISKTKNTKVRLNMSGKDEMANIAITVNNMLMEIDATHRELIKLSYHDKLTGLKNRTYIDKCFARLDSKNESSYSIILGDVNGLKLTNDTYGHKEGDKLICKMANILKDVSAKDDIVCRWGGDEFLILIIKKDNSYVENLIELIKNQCNKITDFGFNVSMAIGSSNNDVFTNAEAVMNVAEENMYRSKLIQVQSSRNATIKSLEKTLYEKNSETEEHTQRIKTLSLKLGEKINLSQDKLNELELLSLLHDIGKIGIPEHILMKPGKLTTEEWEVMKRHTEIGYRIAKATPGMEYVASEILSHHEKYDGTGYPKGLKGEEIPILSRIINIVDSFDVMTHKRIYKDASSFDYAIQELKRCSGTQFDPALVEEFLKLFNK